MDELTKKTKEVEETIIATINQSGLPLILIDYMLSNILRQVQIAEQGGGENESVCEDNMDE